MIGNSNDETNFPHKSLLTKTKISRLRKAVANNLSANTNLSKTQLFKIGESGGFSGRPLGPLLKNGLSLTKKVSKLLAESALIPLRLIAAVSATDVAIQKKVLNLISNKEMDNIMKIVKSLKDAELLIKDVTETINNEAK